MLVSLFYIPVQKTASMTKISVLFLTLCFRLRSKNESGTSPWSDEVTYSTLPDKPSRPSKPVVKGRIHAHSFKLKWESPNHTGGSEITM